MRSANNQLVRYIIVDLCDIISTSWLIHWLNCQTMCEINQTVKRQRNKQSTQSVHGRNKVQLQPILQDLKLERDEAPSLSQ